VERLLPSLSRRLTVSCTVLAYRSGKPGALFSGYLFVVSSPYRLRFGSPRLFLVPRALLQVLHCDLWYLFPMHVILMLDACIWRRYRSLKRNIVLRWVRILPQIHYKGCLQGFYHPPCHTLEVM